jgi:DNA-binding LytR/AlgR family response regulator
MKGVFTVLTIAICDDNLHFSTTLSKKLHDLCAKNLSERIDCQIAPTFSTAHAVINYLKKSSINILFLDIDMPDINGFKLAEYLCKNHPDTVIIFVSSYEDFVYSSFEYCPFRFLRKSHLKEELPITFKKAIDKCIFDNEALTFFTTDGEEILRVKDIILFEGQKNYYAIHTTSGKVYKCRGTLNSAEQMVNKFDFYRIQSSYIVNLEHIESLDNEFITMKNSMNISISRRKYNEFKSSYMQYVRRRITKE